MMETFLLFLRPADNTALHKLAETAVTQAHAVGAPFLEPHRDKALIHSWLSWQDPPGSPWPPDAPGHYGGNASGAQSDADRIHFMVL